MRIRLGARVGAFCLLERVLVVQCGDSGAAAQADGSAGVVVVPDVVEGEIGWWIRRGERAAGQKPGPPPRLGAGST